jgi:hypothetical protein
MRSSAKSRPIDAPVEAWMVKAAEEIDRKLGLPRFDLAIEQAAALIAVHHAEGHANASHVTKLPKKKPARPAKPQKEG